MSDDDQAPSAAASVIPVALGAAAGLVDPTGITGVGIALVAHYVANSTADSAWRRACFVDAREVLTDSGKTEKGKERARRHSDNQNEADQQRIILEWLQEDLADVLGRVENLEIIALGLLRRSESLLRQQSDPAMRPYLLNAFRNSVRRPKYFNGTWSARLYKFLEQLGADHLRVLVELAGDAAFRTQHQPMQFRPNALTSALQGVDGPIATELYKLDLLQRSSDYMSVVALRLVEFVSPPRPQTTGAAAQ